MKNSEIKILAYYAHPGDEQERDARILAAYNFINYMRDSIIRTGKSVKIISASRTRSKTNFWGRKLDVETDSFSVQYLPTFPQKNKLYKLLDFVLLHWAVFFELMKCNKNDTVVVYHSTACMNTIQIAHWIKKFNWVLYVGEIYGDVSLDQKLKKKELRHSCHADSYIFATEFLDKLVNKRGKPYVVLYGAYHNEPIRETIKELKDSTKIHCVYAGTFDHRKGEAQQSVRAAEYLPSNYIVHICGFGTNNDTNEIKELIDKVNSKEKGKVVYEGRLHGEAFIELLQKCDIGLFTPIADAEFNNSDFPSKIFSYMTNGLYVVSARVEPVEKSQIGKYMYYYDGNNPKEIARSIQSVDTSKPSNSREVVVNVEKDYYSSLKSLLK